MDVRSPTALLVKRNLLIGQSCFQSGEVCDRVETDGDAAVQTIIDGTSECIDAQFLLLEKAQSGADHLAGAAVASLFYGDLNKIVKMRAKGH